MVSGTRRLSVALHPNWRNTSVSDVRLWWVFCSAGFLLAPLGYEGVSV